MRWRHGGVFPRRDALLALLLVWGGVYEVWGWYGVGAAARMLLQGMREGTAPGWEGHETTPRPHNRPPPARLQQGVVGTEPGTEPDTEPGTDPGTSPHPPAQRSGPAPTLSKSLFVSVFSSRKKSRDEVFPSPIR